MKRLVVCFFDLLLTALALSSCLVFLANGAGECPGPNVPPVAAFTYSPEFPYVYDIITFDPTASYDPNGWIYSYTWDFGDGNVTVLSAPVYTPIITHYYVIPGEYNVTLTVMDDNGATNSTTKTLYVKARVLADFSYYPPLPYVNEHVTFDASNSTGGDGVIVEYKWNFGDGNETSLATPVIVHSYADPGLYNITLNVTNSNGEWNTKSSILNVTISPEIGPTAAFQWTPTIPEAGHPVEFEASESAAGSGEIVTYAWNFGDGATSESGEPVATHVYASFGNYLVSLNVTNNYGLSGTVDHSVTVAERPVADFFFNPTEPRAYGYVNFNASISDARGGEIVSYEWTFGDGSPVQFGIAPTHVFKRIGEYPVSLNVTDSEGFWAIKEANIKVLRHIADLNEDNVVNILDIAILAKAVGSRPGEEKWNPRADIDGNGVINIIDAVAIARCFNMFEVPIDP